MCLLQQWLLGSLNQVSRKYLHWTADALLLLLSTLVSAISWLDSLFADVVMPCPARLPLQVAEVMVAALRQPAAANKVVEIVSNPEAAELAEEQWFAV